MIVSDKTASICKLTAPVLAKHSVTVTNKLYEKLYEKDPESKKVFGGDHEEQSKQFQRSIELYANYIETPAVNKLKNHADNSSYSGLIQESLIQAIKEVFGDAANDDVIAAWNESYPYLGEIVIYKNRLLGTPA